MTQPKGVDPPGLAEALDLAARGLRVFPLHDVASGRCSCRKPQCKNPGKHPRTANGFKAATTDPDTLRAWWKRWPTANLGIATGAISGFFAVDIDPRHDGEETLKSLEALYGSLPDTPEVETGSGGRHYFFLHPGRKVPTRASVAPGIDVRGDGGYVVAPPSLHESGNPYRWLVHVDEEPLAELPEPWWALIEENTAATANGRPPDAVISEGARNDTLFRLACSMRTTGLGSAEILPALQAINTARCRPPLDNPELSKIANSAVRYPPGASVASAASVATGTPYRAWPKPLEEAAYHGLAGDFVRLVDPHSEADSAALLLQFLAAFGNAIGRSAHFTAEGDRHAMNLYVVIVGETAKARKGSSWGRVREVFEAAASAWSESRILSGLSTGEGLIWQVRDAIIRPERNTKSGQHEDVVIDAGVRDKRLLAFEAEFASVLRRMDRDGNSLSAVMRDAWDRGDLRTLTKNSPANASGAHVSLIGHTTKQEANRYLSLTEAANGYGNRIIWICARRSKLLPEGGRVPTGQRAAFVERLRPAIDFASTQCELKRDEEARALWYEVYPQLSAGRPGLLGAMTARAEPQTMRVASTYALLDLSATIRRVHLEAALAVWRYAEASAGWVFGDSLGDPVSDEILRALRGSSDGLTRTEIRDLFGRHQKKAQIGRALALLEDQGLAHSVSVPTSGRPAETWFPGATEAPNATKDERPTEASVA